MPTGRRASRRERHPSRSRERSATCRLRLVTATAVVAGVGVVGDIAIRPAPVARAAASDLTGVWSGGPTGPWTSNTPGGIGVSATATAPLGGAFATLKLETIIKALTSNPAKILKLNKGNLSIGNDADFCIVDLEKPWIVKKEKLISKSKNTSIEDKKLQGKVTSTFVNGKELFKL